MQWPRDVVQHDFVEIVEGYHTYHASDKLRRYDNSIIQFKLPPCGSNNRIYYEVKVISIPIKWNDSAIGLGFAPINYPKDGMVGWYDSSIGYHSDDGIIYTGDESWTYDEKDNFEEEEEDIMEDDEVSDDESWESVASNEDVKLETYGPGDTVGVLWDLNSGEIQFSKNGKLLNPIYIRKESMIPTITADRGITFSVNFGEKEPFMLPGIPPEKNVIRFKKNMIDLWEKNNFCDTIIINKKY
jgi:hypothetical protein